VQDEINLPAPALETALPPAVLEAAVRAMVAALVPRQPPAVPGARAVARPDLPPLLSPLQVARLIGVSRQTVDRMVDDGELPSVVLRQGGRQRMVRIPARFVIEMLADLNSGTRVSLKEYAARWTASAGGRS